MLFLGICLNDRIDKDAMDCREVQVRTLIFIFFNKFFIVILIRRLASRFTEQNDICLYLIVHSRIGSISLIFV